MSDHLGGRDINKSSSRRMESCSVQHVAVRRLASSRTGAPEEGNLLGGEKRVAVRGIELS